ncbi:hypothetical protein chiPu_0032991, partial [Chiloscyllium punctatum]|nr:hypothetical protein [Chiloscyllium punctatum]
RGEPAGNQTIDDLHALDVPGIGHHLEQRGIERQRALQPGEIGEARLTQQLGLLALGTIGIVGVDAVDILDDRQPGGAERISEQERAGVGAVQRDARVRKLVMVIGRERAADHRARRGEVDRKLARDGRMLDIGHAVRREQAAEDMAVLPGLARRERLERADRQSEVEADAVEMAGADAGAGQD